MKKDLKFPLDIQYFAEDANEDTGTEEKDQEESANEEKEKTFTQAEVDEIVSARLKRQQKKETSKEDEEQEDEASVEEVENPYVAKYVQAEIKVAMTQNGIDAAKVNRAVRLIDHTMVIGEDGDVDTEKLNNEIGELLKEWPELGKETDEEKKQFKFGSDKESNKGSEDDVIAKAFGNTK